MRLAMDLMPKKDLKEKGKRQKKELEKVENNSPEGFTKRLEKEEKEKKEKERVRQEKSFKKKVRQATPSNPAWHPGEETAARIQNITLKRKKLAEEYHPLKEELELDKETGASADYTAAKQARMRELATEDTKALDQQHALNTKLEEERAAPGWEEVDRIRKEREAEIAKRQSTEEQENAKQEAILALEREIESARKEKEVAQKELKELMAELAALDQREAEEKERVLQASLDELNNKSIKGKDPSQANEEQPAKAEVVTPVQPKTRENAYIQGFSELSDELDRVETEINEKTSTSGGLLTASAMKERENYRNLLKTRINTLRELYDQEQEGGWSDGTESEQEAERERDATESKAEKRATPTSRESEAVPAVSQFKSILLPSSRPEISTGEDTEDTNKKLDNLRKELESTNKFRILKRTGLERQIRELEMGENRKNNPFNWFTIDQLSEKSAEVVFRKGKADITPWDQDVIMPGEGERNYTIVNMHEISKEFDYAMSAATNGVYLRIANSDKVRKTVIIKDRKGNDVKEDAGIDFHSPEAVFDIVRPDGQTVQIIGDVATATQTFHRVAREYQDELIRKFESVDSSK
jgi:hypothetical protein